MRIVLTGSDHAADLRRSAARRAHRTRVVPECQPLEGRALLSAGPQVTRRILLTPIAHGTPLAEHIHPHLTIIIYGRAQPIPAGIGILPSGDLPIHTHAADGVLHVESTRRLPFKLRDFFTIWGKPFTNRNILGNVAGPGHKIVMTVNGRPSNQFGNLALQDGQQIVIRYT